MDLLIYGISLNFSSSYITCLRQQKFLKNVVFRLNYLSNASVSRIWDLRLMTLLEDILKTVEQAAMCNSTISAALIYRDRLVFANFQCLIKTPKQLYNVQN